VCVRVCVCMCVCVCVCAHACTKGSNLRDMDLQHCEIEAADGHARAYFESVSRRRDPTGPIGCL
jgi:hypothetical protein